MDTTTELSNIGEVLQYVQPLTLEQYEAACKQAKEKAIAQLRPPEKPVIRMKTNTYPKWLNRSILGGVGALLLAMFIVSTAKQLEAVHDFVAPVTDTTQWFFQWLVIVSVIMASEIGALLFSIAAGVMQHYRRVFRLFSILSAFSAILANWHVTALHSKEYTGIAVYAWYVTFLAPIVVIVVGMLLENIAMRSISDQAELRNVTELAEAEYEERLREYRNQVDEIETTDLYQRRYLPVSIKAALETGHRQNRQILIERPDVVRYAVKREMLRFVFEYQEPEALPESMAPKVLPRVTSRNMALRIDTPAVTGVTPVTGVVTLCEHCHQEPAKGRGRFCSDKCRVAAHRAKKVEESDHAN